MFLNCLFCLLGATAQEDLMNRKNSTPDTVGSPISPVDNHLFAGGGIKGGDQGAIVHTPLQLEAYYYQHIEQLQKLSRLYEQHPNDPGVCKAIVEVLKKFLNSAKMSDYRDVIDELEICASKKNLDFLVRFINIDEQTVHLSEQTAPLTYFEKMGQEFRNVGNITQSRNAFKRYEAVCAPLVDWAEQFVEQFINKAS